MSDPSGEPRRSYHPTDGHPTDGHTGDAATSEARRRRRAAIEDLGEALRELVERSATTEASADDLHAAAAELRRITDPLAVRTRTRARMPTADDLLGGIRMYNPVSGP